MKRIYAKEEACIGCRLCEIHCQVEHSPSRDILKTFKKDVPPPARIRVHEAGATSLGIQCRQCDEPECAYSCITGALFRDEATGEVVHDPDRCVGCWTCVMVCTRGAVKPDFRGPRRAAKCDLCPEREVPACVQACPNEALILVEE